MKLHQLKKGTAFTFKRDPDQRYVLVEIDGRLAKVMPAHCLMHGNVSKKHISYVNSNEEVQKIYILTDTVESLGGWKIPCKQV